MRRGLNATTESELAAQQAMDDADKEKLDLIKALKLNPI